MRASCVPPEHSHTGASATTCAGTTPTGALLAWDNEGRLTAWQNLANVTTTPTSTPALEEALYDGEGQRVQQLDESNTTKTTTLHTYVGGTEDLASQWANSGGSATTTTTAYYASGLAQSVNGALSYTLGDSLGSVSASVNASGTVSANQLYGPYGNVRYQNGTLPTDYGFTHQRADATSGLDYYGARYYDPVAGQFTSADTASAGGLNRYAYVGGNPETRTDPSGHCPMCITAAVGALAGFVIGFGGSAIWQVSHSNGDWSKVDWGTALKVGAGGAVAGGLIGLTLGFAAPGIVGSLGAVGVAGEGAAGVSAGTAATAGTAGVAGAIAVDEAASAEGAGGADGAAASGAGAGGSGGGGATKGTAYEQSVRDAVGDTSGPDGHRWDGSQPVNESLRDRGWAGPDAVRNYGTSNETWIEAKSNVQPGADLFDPFTTINKNSEWDVGGNFRQLARYERAAPNFEYWMENDPSDLSRQMIEDAGGRIRIWRMH